MTTARSRAQTSSSTRPADHVAVGQFHLEVATDRWTWSDEVYQIHGFEPHEVVPTSELMRAHSALPDDIHASVAVAPHLSPARLP